MPNSAVLTKSGKKAAVDELKGAVATTTTESKLVKDSLRSAKKAVAEALKVFERTDKEHTKTVNRLLVLKTKLQEVRTIEVVSDALAPATGVKKRGRPSKADIVARAAQVSGLVEVPENLQPLIRVEDAISGDTPIASVAEAVS